MPPTDENHGYLVEFVVIGGSVKVTAMDPHTLREVSIIGARSVSRKQLAELAIRKLQYVTNKDKDQH